MTEKSLRKLRIRSENIRILLAELIGTFILIVSKILFLYIVVYFKSDESKCQKEN